MIVGEYDHEAALLAVLLAANVPARPMMRYSSIEEPPTEYVEVMVAQKVDDPSVFRGRKTLTDSYRAMTRVVAEQRESAQELRRLTTLALDYKPLMVGGIATTPLYRALSDDPIALDDGWYSGVSEWAYAWFAPAAA